MWEQHFLLEKETHNFLFLLQAVLKVNEHTRN